MDTQLLGYSLMDISQCEYHILVQSGESIPSWLYQQSIGSQCKIKDQRYCVGYKNHSKWLSPSRIPDQDIYLGNTSDCWKLKLPLVRLFWRWRGRCWPAGAVWGREWRRMSSVLPPNLSDTAATIQDGSSLDFIAAIAGRQCFIQDASGRGLLAEVTNGRIFFLLNGKQSLLFLNR